MEASSMREADGGAREPTIVLSLLAALHTLDADEDVADEGEHMLAAFQQSSEGHSPEAIVEELVQYLVGEYSSGAEDPDLLISLSIAAEYCNAAFESIGSVVCKEVHRHVQLILDSSSDAQDGLEDRLRILWDISFAIAVPLTAEARECAWECIRSCTEYPKVRECACDAIGKDFTRHTADDATEIWPSTGVEDLFSLLRPDSPPKMVASSLRASMFILEHASSFVSDPDDEGPIVTWCEDLSSNVSTRLFDILEKLASGADEAPESWVQVLQAASLQELFHACGSICSAPHVRGGVQQAHTAISEVLRVVQKDGLTNRSALIMHCALDMLAGLYCVSSDESFNLLADDVQLYLAVLHVATNDAFGMDHERAGLISSAASAVLACPKGVIPPHQLEAICEIAVASHARGLASLPDVIMLCGDMWAAVDCPNLDGQVPRFVLSVARHISEAHTLALGAFADLLLTSGDNIAEHVLVAQVLELCSEILQRDSPDDPAWEAAIDVVVGYVTGVGPHIERTGGSCTVASSMMLILADRWDEQWEENTAAHAAVVGLIGDFYAVFGSFPEVQDLLQCPKLHEIIERGCNNEEVAEIALYAKQQMRFEWSPGVHLKTNSEFQEMVQTLFCVRRVSASRLHVLPPELLHQVVASLFAIERQRLR